jgi:spermidine synthase
VTTRTVRTLLVFLFFTSGLASLVLETVWVRMMVLVFGSTTFALSTVLTAFMGGLALGSFAAGRRAERLVDPRRAMVVYGILELGIGLYALCLPWLVARIHLVHAALWGGVHSSYYTFALLRFLLSAAVLLIPTVAMGATLPVLARFFCAGQGRDAVGEQVGTLYAVNTTGAVTGVFLAGFVLLPRVGTWTTNLLACGADLSLGALALLLAAGAARGSGATKDTARGRKGRSPAARGSGATKDTARGRKGRSPAARGSGATKTKDTARGAREPEAVVTRSEDPPSAPGRKLLPRFALASIAVSGAVAMVYQVAWTRGMSLIIGSSTYAFSLILICFLVGLAGGAALYSRRQARQPDQPANLSVIHLLIAVTAFTGILFMDQLPVVLVTLLKRVDLAPAVVFLLKFLVAGTVILLPTFFMGMVFPAVIAICSGGAGKGAARITGDVYAVNTLGSIAGSFAAGFLLVPLLGLQQSLVLMVVAGLLLAALFGLLAARRVARLPLAGAAVLAALGVLYLARPWNLEVMTAGVFRVSRYEALLGGTEHRREEAVPRDDRLEQAARRLVPTADVVDTLQEPAAGYAVVFHREGVTTTVSMARTVEGSLSSRACWVRHSLLVNGKPDASLSVLRARPAGGCKALLAAGRLAGPGLAVSPAGDAETQILSGLLPVLLHPGGDPRTMLIIGWGSGITAGAALQAPLERVTAVELEREVIEAARHFEPENHAPQRNPRLRLVNEDGRNYLAVSPERFDVVVSEPSNPWIAGCGNLFTREFFELVRSRLGPRGVYLQWLQAYEIAPRNVRSILATLNRVFPSTFVFRPVQASSDLLIVALKGEDRLDWDALRRRMRLPGVRRELGRIRIRRPADIVARLIAGPRGIRRRIAGVPLNTDDNARIEFATPKDLINYQRYSASSITGKLVEPLARRRRYVKGRPADFVDRLCWALLDAGRPTDAATLRRASGRATPGALERCHEVAARLSEPIAAPDLELLGLSGVKPRVALKRLLGRRDPPFAVLGHLYARLDRPFPALAYLLAARRQGSTYSPLEAVLSLVYQDRGHYPLAVRKARSSARLLD